MAKKKFGVVSVMLGSALALTACGGTDDDSSTGEEGSGETYVLQAVKIINRQIHFSGMCNRQ